MMFTNYREAEAEARYIHEGGDGMYTTWIFLTPDNTFYVVPDARYHETPDEDIAVAKYSNYELFQF